MSIWTPNLNERSGPRYLAIADALATDVSEGRLPPGTRLPPQRDLAWELKVTVGTVARAYSEAGRRGLVSGEVGRGTYVLDPRVTGDEWNQFHRQPPDQPNFIDMSINRPTGDNSAGDVATALRRLADDPALPALLGYRIDTPWPHHAAAGARWLKREGVDVAPARIIPTVGGQQAITTVIGALTRPGDTVLAEELTYPGLKRAANLIDRAVDSVAMDNLGLVPEALDAALAKRPGAVVYCMPTLHNPTAITMPASRRRAIAEVVQRHRTTLVEDGIYAFLNQDAPPPVWALMPDQVVYITSLSKAVSPGLRMGFVAAPEPWVSRILAAIAATTMMMPAIIAELATTLIESGAAERAAAEQRAEAGARIEIARSMLGAERCPPGPSDNLWLMLPPGWRADAFAAEALRRGVLVTEAVAFAAGPRVPKAVRVSVSAPVDRAQLRQGLEVIARLLGDSPDRLALTV